VQKQAGTYFLLAGLLVLPSLLSFSNKKIPLMYVRNENLATIKEGYAGNAVHKGVFMNYENVPLPTFWRVMKWQMQTNPQKLEKKQDTWFPEVIKNNSMFADKRDKIVWLGHASFLITSGGTTFLTDPVFNDIPFVKRRVGIPFDRDSIQGIDYILLSHGHFDHCDKQSLQTLAKTHKQLHILTGLRMQDLLRSFAPNADVQEAGWYQQYSIPNSDIRIYYMPAFHWYKRGVNDNNTRLWGSFVIKTPNRTLFFMGDSGYNTHFKEIAEFFPDIDICFMGVGAYKPSYIMKSSHTSPEEAVHAFHDLRGKTFVPMHYGTYDLADEPAGEPVRILDSLQRHDRIHGKLKWLKIGETWHL
jgi:L-ascorbate metabolism protein UlaG (beta-lactamase superfamily)